MKERKQIDQEKQNLKEEISKIRQDKIDLRVKTMNYKNDLESFKQ